MDANIRILVTAPFVGVCTTPSQGVTLTVSIHSFVLPATSNPTSSIQTTRTTTTTTAQQLGNKPSCIMHKSGSSSSPANFHPIQLTNCDVKLFFSIVASRITSYMCQNGYFDGLTQKGFLPGIAGCKEHTKMSLEAIRDARLHHRKVCFAWLYLKKCVRQYKTHVHSDVSFTIPSPIPQ